MARTTRCNDDPISFLIEDDRRQFIGMLVKAEHPLGTSDDVWECFLGTNGNEEPLGKYVGFRRAVRVVEEVSEADKIVAVAKAMGKLGRVHE